MDVIRVCVLLLGFHTCVTLSTRVRMSNSNVQSEYLANLDRARNIRAVSSDSRRNCSTWSPWVDEHKPTAVDRQESESWTQQQIADFCPGLYGGAISKFECNDDRGEAFTKNKTLGSTNEFAIGCYDFNVGVTCSIIKTSTDPCPDLRIRYFCTCSSQVPLTQPTSTVRTTQDQTTGDSPSTTNSNKAKSGTVSSRDVETLDIEGLRIAWWLFILIAGLILFMVNCLFTICMYKRATGKMKQKRKTLKVHPA